MQIKFSEDVISFSELKVNPGKIVNRTKNSHRPILLTSRGKGIAVVQGLIMPLAPVPLLLRELKA